MKRNAASIVLVAFGAFVPLLSATACSSSRNAVANKDVSFHIVPSAKEVVAGEIVTVTTRSENVLGKDAKVKWSTTGGDLKTEEHGSVARVKFDKPGTYAITGKLMIDGHESRVDSANVSVLPLK